MHCHSKPPILNDQGMESNRAALWMSLLGAAVLSRLEAGLKVRERYVCVLVQLIGAYLVCGINTQLERAAGS